MPARSRERPGSLMGLASRVKRYRYRYRRRCGRRHRQGSSCRCRYRYRYAFLPRLHGDSGWMARLLRIAHLSAAHDDGDSGKHLDGPPKPRLPDCRDCRPRSAGRVRAAWQRAASSARGRQAACSRSLLPKPPPGWQAALAPASPLPPEGGTRAGLPFERQLPSGSR